MALSTESRLIRVRVDDYPNPHSLALIKPETALVPLKVDKKPTFWNRLVAKATFLTSWVGERIHHESTPKKAGLEMGVRRGRERFIPEAFNQAKETAAEALRVARDHDMIAFGVGGAIFRFTAAHALNMDVLSFDMGMKVAASALGTMLVIDKMKQAALFDKLNKIEEKHPLVYSFIRSSVSRAFLFTSAWSLEGVGEGAYYHFLQTTPAMPETVSAPLGVVSVDVQSVNDLPTASTINPDFQMPASGSEIAVSGFDNLDPRVDLEVSPQPTVVPVEQPDAPLIDNTNAKFSLTTPQGVLIEGSLADGTLTNNGVRWELLENGLRQTGKLTSQVIDSEAMIVRLTEAVELWGKGELDIHPDHFRLFHLANGTSSVAKDVMAPETVAALERLNIFH